LTPPPLTLIKLGGSLITDKRRPGRARRQVIARLAGEIAAGAGTSPGRLVVGHGSGSFGHPAAARHGVHRGDDGGGPAGVAETQARAATLHRLVVDALLEAGATPFSLAPSSFMAASAGRPVGLSIEPLMLALDRALLPVTYGDVVLDRRQGAAICSTETVFTALIRALGRRGRPVRRVLWLGETEGVWDAAGQLVGEITRANLAPVLEAAGAAAGTDVTGGMRHRLETAAALARHGVESWILDGLVPGRLARALGGDVVPGTRVLPTAGAGAGKRG
jgi:isopentenyl phosphate kinase